MDNEILVKEFRKIVSILKNHQNHVFLFMLKTIDADISNWNLIISTSEYDHLTTKKALKHLLSILQKNISKEILKNIIRLTVLKTDDPFVKEINRTFHVIDSFKYVLSSVISGIDIEKAIILESDSL